MNPHLEVPREGGTCVPLEVQSCEMLVEFEGWHHHPSCCAGRIPLQSHALEPVVWFVRSGEGPSLVLKLFYMNTLQLFPLWRCSCWSDLLCSAVSAEETLWV